MGSIRLRRTPRGKFSLACVAAVPDFEYPATPTPATVDTIPLDDTNRTVWLALPEMKRPRDKGSKARA